MGVSGYHGHKSSSGEGINLNDFCRLKSSLKPRDVGGHELGGKVRIRTRTVPLDLWVIRPDRQRFLPALCIKLVPSLVTPFGKLLCKVWRNFVARRGLHADVEYSKLGTG